MEDAYEWKGLNGQLVTFKKEVGDAQKITFVGSPGVCTPFAEFLAYSVRDKETCFKSYAMVLKDELYDPHNSDVVVLLGGLSMPKYDVDTNELMVLVNEILKEDGKLIGVCFMNMFEKAGWLEKIDFDCVVDGTLVGVVKK